MRFFFLLPTGDSSMISHTLVRACCAVALLAWPLAAPAQTVEPNLDPESGEYTIGLYADRQGSTELKIGEDVTSFEVFIGIDGDPERNFSGMALRLELPDFLENASAILWRPVEGLHEKELIWGNGGQVVFTACDAQTGDAPLMIGRFEVEVDPRFREATLQPQPHRQYGLSVQLCEQQGKWPKRLAEAVSMRVVRTTSFWDRVKSWFD